MREPVPWPFGFLLEQQFRDQPQPLGVQRDLLAVDVEVRSLAGREHDVDAVLVGAFADELEEAGFGRSGFEPGVHARQG
jgi:hypothetical protein